MSSPTRYNQSPYSSGVDSKDSFKNETHYASSPTCVSTMKSLQLQPSKSSVAQVDDTKTTAVSVSTTSLFVKPAARKRESMKMFDNMLIFQNLFRHDDDNNEHNEDDPTLEKFPLHMQANKTSDKTSDGENEGKMVLKRQQRTSTIANLLPNDLDLPTFEQARRTGVLRSRLAPISHSSKKEFIHFKKVEHGSSLFDPDEVTFSYRDMVVTTTYLQKEKVTY